MTAGAVRVTRAAASDFRNYERLEVDLEPGLNVACGPNGAGKTNLLEAIYFGCSGRSCRTSDDRQVVRFGAPATHVVVDVEADDGSHRLEAGYERGADRRLKVDGASVERLADSPVRPLMEVFLPDRLELVKGPPAGRRAHLDQVVAALWPARDETRVAYGRALAQRNALIARVRAEVSGPDLLEPWDVELARLGIELMADRTRATELLAPAFVARSAELGLAGDIELAYRPRSSAADADGLRAELADARDADLKRGYSGHGPHRDELALKHEGRPLRAYGSQGQQRLALLALLFAERDVVIEQRGRAPLMLLDDVMSELDEHRRGNLVELLRAEGQTLITATEPAHVPGHDGPWLEVAGEGTVARVDQPGNQALAA